MPPRPTSRSRRQTLGSVSVNHGSRRKSIDPMSGPSASKARPPRGRRSMIPSVGRENLLPQTPKTDKPNRQAASTGRRRSSIGGRRQSLVPPSPSVPVRTDSRPITDKAYQKECIKQLLDFLHQSGYDQPVSPKSLTRPSGKDFTNIVTFMLRRVDPNFQDGTMKIEDEISMNFKAMGYPFTVSKTALVAAGSPHTWPTLLAALTWLMERIRCMENIKQENDDPGKFESLEELENKTDKAFFKYLSAAYTAFLRGDEEMTEQLENALADRFERDDAVIVQEIEQMTDKNAVMVERINNLAHGEQDLADYTEKRKGYSTDLEQFQDLIQQMDQHVSALEEKKRDRAQELEETNHKLERVNAHVEDLKQAISSQDLSVEDVQKIQNELKGVEEATDRAIILRDQRRTALLDAESELDKLWNDMETILSDYNSQLGELALLPLLSAKSIKMKAVLNKKFVLDKDKSKMLGVALPTSVQPALLSTKFEYSEKLSQAKWKFQEALDELEASEEAFSEAHEKLKIIDAKIEKCEETINAERDAQDAKLAVRAREADSMENRVAALRDPVALEEQMAQFERQCTDLETLRMKHEEDNVARKKAVCDEIERACDAMKEYDEFCLQKIAEVEAYRTESLNALGNVHLPEDMEHVA